MLSEDERRWAADILSDLRWKPDMLVEPDDYPGQRWWLTTGGGGLMACCQREHPCPHHAGQPVEGHCLRWSRERNWWVCSCGRLSAEHADVE